MPNIVQLWDFEDGTTQGWSLGQYSSLDSNSKVQGKYSIKYSRGGFSSVDDLVISISGIDLSTTSKPMIVMVVKDESGHGANDPGDIGIVVKDSSGNKLLDETVRVSYITQNFFRIVVVDLSKVAGKSNLTIEIRERGFIGYYEAYTRTQYFDMIAIIDGADYEYSTGLVVNDNEDKTIDINVPDSNLSTLSVDRLGICLTTPDWDYNVLKFTAVTDQVTIDIDSSNGNIKNANYSNPSNTINSFSKIQLYARLSVGNYVGFTEKVAVVFLDSSWKYKRVYLFTINYTVNGISPTYVSVVETTTYGSNVSGSRDIKAKIHGTSLSLALKARFLVGDHTMVSSGSITMTVYSSDKSTNYGSVSIDLTQGDEQTTKYIDNIPTDKDIIITISYNISANARVVIIAYPIAKVA